MGKILGWTKINNRQWRSDLTHKTINIERYSPKEWFVSVKNMYGSEVRASKGLPNIKSAEQKAVEYAKLHPNG